MKQSKQQLRKQIKQQLAQLSHSQILVESEAIWAQIEQLEQFKSARNIALYWSMEGEVATHQIVERWSHGKDVYLPIVCGRDMYFSRYRGSANMREGAYGILEPTDSTPSLAEPLFDLIIVPALSYDSDGHRLGRGGGYYDRYFAKLQNQETSDNQQDRQATTKQQTSTKQQQRQALPKHLLGVCLGLQLLESVPCEEFDFSVDTVVTPQKVVTQTRK